MFNYALHITDTNAIIKMGFFIRDLHHQIEQLYQKQINDDHKQPFVVYKGQGLSITDFEKFLKAGLISFNNLLFTSKNKEVFLGYAEAALTKTNMVSILLQMSIDPSVSSAPFACIRKVSCFNTEEEIVLSMHTGLRVDGIILHQYGCTTP